MPSRFLFIGASASLLMLSLHCATPSTTPGGTTSTAPPPAAMPGTGIDEAYPGPGTGIMTEAKAAPDIESTGISLEAGSPVTQAFLTAAGTVYRAPGGTIQIYEYPTEAAAEADAELIRLQGFGPAKITWAAAPHFYRRNATLVIYVGSEGKVLAGLTRVMGGEVEVKR